MSLPARALDSYPMVRGCIAATRPGGSEHKVTRTSVETRSAAVARHDWQRDFVRLWQGSAISQLGTRSAAFATPLLAFSLTGSPVFAGWAAAMGTLPDVLLQLPIGVLVDRMDRRRVMIVSQLVQGAVAVALVVTLFFLGGPVNLLPVMAAIQGICAAFYNVAEITMVPRIVPHAELSRALAKNEARTHAALLLGRPLGGFLFGLERTLPYLADALSSGISVISLLKIKANGFSSTAVAGPYQLVLLLRELRAGVAFLWRDPFLRRVLVVCTITNLLFQTITLLLVVIAKQENLPSLMIGILLAASGIGGVLGALVAPRALHAIRPSRMVIICVWGWLMLVAAIAISEDKTVILLAWAGVGFTGAHMNVSLAVYQATEVPKALLGRVASANRFFSGGAVPLGALSSGYLIAALGPRQCAALAAAIIGLLAIALAARATMGRVRFVVRGGRALKRWLSVAHGHRTAWVFSATALMLGIMTLSEVARCY